MLDFKSLIRLPPLLLTIILQFPNLSVASGALTPHRWPCNLPAHVKYYPEHEAMHRAQEAAQCRLQTVVPVGLSKMTDDPGQKFFLDMWSFTEDAAGAYSNGTTLGEFGAPLRTHPFSWNAQIPRQVQGDLFRRDFQCPTGSSPCTSISKPDACCATGSTCQLIQDTGLGDVGCCPANQVCGGSVSTCPSGYSSCPNAPGGGCCIPGYACFKTGCVAVSTAIVVYTPPTPSTNTLTTTLVNIGSIVTITETSTVIVNPIVGPSTSIISSLSPSQPDTQINTATLVITAPTTTTVITVTLTSTTLTSSSTCSSGYKSCPISLGGGCCPTDRACGSDICPPLSTSITLVAPARPTSNTASTSTSTLGSNSIVGCPTGFYACSAVYGGGCCQTGRDCDVTSCPASSFTIVGQSSNSITIVASRQSGLTSAQVLLTGNCAAGWSSCAATVGGGCCPTGYACGTACTATGAGASGAMVGKIAPNNGSRTSVTSLLVSTILVAVLITGLL